MSAVSVWLEADASAPRRARHHVQSHCRQLPVETLHVVTLLTSEIVTNAVVHGAGAARLEILVEQNMVTVGVSDRGGGSVRPASRFSWPETGHGLTIVQAMADRWGVEQLPEAPGKRVWFELTWRTDAP